MIISNYAPETGFIRYAHCLTLKWRAQSRLELLGGLAVCFSDNRPRLRSKCHCEVLTRWRSEISKLKSCEPQKQRQRKRSLLPAVSHNIVMLLWNLKFCPCTYNTHHDPTADCFPLKDLMLGPRGFHDSPKWDDLTDVGLAVRNMIW